MLRVSDIKIIAFAFRRGPPIKDKRVTLRTFASEVNFEEGKFIFPDIFRSAGKRIGGSSAIFDFVACYFWFYVFCISSDDMVLVTAVSVVIIIAMVIIMVTIITNTAVVIVVIIIVIITAVMLIIMLMLIIEIVIIKMMVVIIITLKCCVCQVLCCVLFKPSLSTQRGAMAKQIEPRDGHACILSRPLSPCSLAAAASLQHLSRACQASLA